MDLDQTQSIAYVITRGDTGRFRLDEVSGRLTTIQELDFERQREYEITVSTRDANGQNNPQYSATVSITVLVSYLRFYMAWLIDNGYLFSKNIAQEDIIALDKDLLQFLHLYDDSYILIYSLFTLRKLALHWFSMESKLFVKWTGYSNDMEYIFWSSNFNLIAL